MNETRPSVSDPLATLRAWEPLSVVPQYETRQGYKSADGVGQVVYRSDTGRALGVVGPETTQLSHRDLCGLFDALAERGVINGAALRCGELAGGRRVFIQGRPAAGSRIEIMPGHVVEHRITALDSHEGGSAIALVDTPTVVVCQNTWQSAHRNGIGTRLRHTSNVEARFREAVRAIHASVGIFAKDVATMRTLASTPMATTEWCALLDEFFPLPKAPTSGADPRIVDAFDRAMANARELRGNLDRWYVTAPGALPGTRYGAMQAVTYYATHERGRAPGREESNWTGESARLSSRVLASLVKGV